MRRLAAMHALLLLAGCATPFASGLALQRAGQLDAAREAYAAAGEHAGALYNLALLEEQRAPAQALELYRDAWQRDPRLHGAYLNGARLWVEAGQPDSAAAWIGYAVHACADHPEPWLARARLALSGAHRERARASVDEALLREPSHVGALALRLLLVPPEGRDAAARQLSQAVSGKPHAEALAGRTLRAVGQTSAALVHLQHAVLAHPEDAELLLELGLCLRDLGHARDALLVLWRAEALRLDDPALVTTLRELYRELLDGFAVEGEQR